MHDDSDIYNGNDSDEEKFYARRSRRSKQRTRVHMTRIQRRTALSLRPISQKCYTDSYHFISDSEAEVGVRRSKRKITSTSWLRDDQMHKVGYPSLNVAYSEESSRDATEAHRDDTRRVTRHSESSTRREIKNPKYLYDYETNEVGSRRKERNRCQSNDKENNEENVSSRANGRLRPIKTEEVQDVAGQSNESTSKNEEVSTEVLHKRETKEDEEEKEEKESDTDEYMPRTRTRAGNNNHIIDTRQRRNQKELESSSSESDAEAGRKYSLRDRVPKPAPKTIQGCVLRGGRERNRKRRFTRRRADKSSSSSTSSTSDEVFHGKPKPPKSPHSKNERMKSGAGGSSKILPIRPETLDANVRFDSIGGLDNHIQCLKEMILLPMMYPEVFRQFKIQLPRGVLFHGPPGTGKTLIARALANECSFGAKKVTFFMRKGADLLSKWIGESEKQLRTLFEQAAEMKPSIIFFDELDGLAPVRSSRQDQVHASIVSTLLALMDGLSDRGEVIVIGATNRIDSIDPALRRPGRFDRELLFPLPSRKEREEILNVHVSHWVKRPDHNLISYLAEHSVGYCGSDLRALCSEAVIMGFRRTYPQVYNSEHRLLLDPENVQVEKVDFMRAKSLLVPASQRITQGVSRKLLPILEPLLLDALNEAMDLLKQSFPHGTNIALAKVKLSPNVRPAQLLITGQGPEYGQTLHLAPAVLFKMEHIHSYIMDLTTLHSETGRSPEEACIQVFNEARRNVPSVIYLPNIETWWGLVSETVHSIFISQLSQLDPNVPILFLATAETIYTELPEPIRNVFSLYRREVFEVELPNSESRRSFFKPLIVDSSLKAPRSPRKRPKTPPLLPRAPTPPPTPITEAQAKKLYENEEHTLRELRIFLRDMCKKLANNKLFYMFTKPVDTEEVPDYTTIIKQPMDLETMMTKVDFHRYECAKDFLTDIELICQNALEYNPARTSADKQIRHRACSLRDYAYTLIKSEMDSDFEDKCQDISKKRRDRKACVSKYLPAYINTPENIYAQAENKKEAEETDKDKLVECETIKEVVVEKEVKTPVQKITPVKKRKAKWQRGYVGSRTRKKPRISETGPEEQNESKGSSNDDLHSESPMKEQSENSSKESKESDENIKTTTNPLTVDCDTNKLASCPLLSPKRRLSDLMSPSELLDDPLDFDDVDQALNETEGNPVNGGGGDAVECSREGLGKVLDTTVLLTDGCTLNSLLDLYNQLNRIVKRYARTHIRTNLPKDLGLEVGRFMDEETSQRQTD